MGCGIGGWRWFVVGCSGSVGVGAVWMRAGMVEKRKCKSVVTGFQLVVRIYPVHDRDQLAWLVDRKQRYMLALHTNVDLVGIIASHHFTTLV